MRFSDSLFNLKQMVLRRPWFMRRPNYTGAIEPGMLFVWEPGSSVSCRIIVTRLGGSERFSDERIIWNRRMEEGMDRVEYPTRESRFRAAVGMHAAPTFDARWTRNTAITGVPAHGR